MKSARSPVSDDPTLLRKCKNRVHKGGGRSGYDGSLDIPRIGRSPITTERSVQVLSVAP